MIDKILSYEFSVFRFQFSGKRFVKHPFFAGSVIMIFGTNIANFFAYLYHLILGRMLGPAAYGELAAILATLGEFSTAFAFLGLVIVKFASSVEESNKPKLFSWFMAKSIYIGLTLLISLLIFTPKVADFLRLPHKTVFLIGPILFLYLFSFLYRSFLQGLLEFSKVVVLTNLDILSRLIFGVIFVWFGLSSFGAVGAILVGAILSYFLGSYFLKKYRVKSKVSHFDGGSEIIKYALPVFVASIANNSLISSDVILAKHFFDAHNAGIYASLSTLGKIVFYGTGPVSAVMFPLVSKKFSKGQNYTKIFILSLGLTSAIAASVVIVYTLLPKLMVSILFGDEFLEAAPKLMYFGVFIAIYTIANVFVSLELSVNRTKVVILPFVFAIAQVVGIFLYHDSIFDLVKVSIVVCTLLLGSLLIYFGYGRKKYEERRE